MAHSHTTIIGHLNIKTGMQQSPESQVSLEILGNLIYLARHSDADSAKRHEYLDWAARVVEELGREKLVGSAHRRG